MAKRKRRILHKLILDEISAVDMPAQEGARAVIMKRKGDPDYDPKNPDKKKRGSLVGGLPIGEVVSVTRASPNSYIFNYKFKTPEAHSFKSTQFSKTFGGVYVLTSEVDGHQHALVLDVGEQGGSTTHAQSDGDEDFGHSHDWVMDAGGAIEIATNDGHSHDVDQGAINQAQIILVARAQARGDFGKSKDLPPKAAGDPGGGTVGTKEGTMPNPDDLKKAADEALAAKDKEIETFKIDLAKAMAVAGLNDAEKVHYFTLKGDDQAVFLVKSADERQAVINAIAKAAAEKDKVEYTAVDGTEFRKSDDPRLVQMAKDRDEDRAALKKSQEETADLNLRKRAEELEHLPGDVETRVAMLKAIDGIEDADKRKSALDALKAQDAGLAKAFQTVGVAGGSVEPGSPNDELNNLAKAEQDKHPELTFEKAFAAVTNTPAGAALYEKTLN